MILNDNLPDAFDAAAARASGRVREQASLIALQAAPQAAANHPDMINARLRRVERQILGASIEAACTEAGAITVTLHWGED